MLKIKENSKNYVCTVIEIKQLFPIEGADKIQRCLVNGNDVVVSKDVKLGDIMLYFVSGTKLNQEYCHKNNLLDKAEMNYDTSKKGFISHKQFRVKAIKLKGVISDGMLMPLSSLLPFLEKSSIDSLIIGNEFTTINNIDLCEKYILPIHNSNSKNKTFKKIKKINRIIDNQFYFHNDTNNLRKNIFKINPNDIIGLHYKKHGTSIVIGNILVKKNLKWYEKIAKKLGLQIIDTQYDIIYSSRKVIKNQYLNENNNIGFYKEDIWGIVAKEVGHLIPKNWTIYGEILGYTSEGSPIQNKYDYGCKQNEHKFYVYKISVVNPDGKVLYLTDKQIEEWCEKVGLLYKDTFIYYGTVFNHLTNLRREGISFDEIDWREKYLMWLEKEYNEKDCYMCINKVPEEGIIVRVEKTFEYEAYKLKSKRFVLMESELQEQEINNIEDEN